MIHHADINPLFAGFQSRATSKFWTASDALCHIIPTEMFATDVLYAYGIGKLSNIDNQLAPPLLLLTRRDHQINLSLLV